MSSYHHTHIPQADQINYHEACQQQRIARAMKLIDPSDVLTLVRNPLAMDSDPTQDPIYQMVLFFLDRTHACDGGKLFDDWKGRILQAIDTLTDDALECLEG